MALHDPATDYPATAVARSFMVDSQVRPNKVTDPRVLDAMRALPRELFVPPAQAVTAYVDQDVPLGGGRVLMQPMTIARLVQLARARPGDRALVIGSGTGYGAAILAACGATVTALEQDEALRAIAAAVLPRLAPAVQLLAGPLNAPPAGPWTLIMIEGAVPELPPGLADVLAPDGRLVGIIAEAGEAGRSAPGQGVLAEPVPGPGARRLRARAAFDCSTATLPGFERTRSFVF